MPSRPISPNQNPISQTTFLQTKAFFLIITISSSVLILFIIFYFIFYLYPSILHRSRTTPLLDSNPPSKLKRFSYRELKKATNSFNVANMLGRGGSGTVYRGVLRDGKSIAVKKLDPSSLQAEREFQNELQILGGLKSPYIVSLLGFCVDSNNIVLVYEYMPNRSLQESLFGDEEKDFLNWVRRFKIIVEIAKALSFLHHDCDPPVIHGDVKPSNVLLDSSHVAKLSDFGLSRVKEVDGEFALGMFSQELSGDLQGQSHHNNNNEVDFALALQSSNFNTSNRCHHNNHLNVVNEYDLSKSRGKEVSNSVDTGGEEMNNFVRYDDELCSSIEYSKELNTSTNSAQWGKDWWWKQDVNCELSSKDYVSEWIGNQAIPSQNLDWEKTKRICPENSPSLGDSAGLDKLEDENKKHMNMQEWWTEEHLNEISKKKGVIKKKGFKMPHFDLGRKYHFKKRRKSEENTENNNDPSMEFSFRRSGKRRNRTHSGGSDQMYSGDLFSRELSSNTSMRGTLCYIAPEYGSCSYLIEKTDIYSLGVLILVIVSGRRPLHVLASPMKLEKANLVSWCRNLALGGNILDLVDEKLVKDGFNKDEASLCINLALICLQKMPELRPDVGEIVRILKGEMELPPLPFEFSPSPPSKLFGRSRRKQKGNAE